MLWADTPASDLVRLEQVAEAVMRAAGARQRLTVVASAATLWLWLPVATVPAREQLEPVLRQNPDVRVAIGTPARGAEGFRRSHREAVEASRLMARVAAPVPLVTFEEVELVSLVEQDPSGRRNSRGKPSATSPRPRPTCTRRCAPNYGSSGTPPPPPNGCSPTATR
ncbi:hypothetical protein ACFUTV_26220 [Streptomyces sp. NPDC057298]|uniref:hypothetical protein n=1 Tax=Streptomyces sp. NPDC057298 TaxID=3346091 RepID=UPI00363ECED0